VYSSDAHGKRAWYKRSSDSRFENINLTLVLYLSFDYTLFKHTIYFIFIPEALKNVSLLKRIAAFERFRNIASAKCDKILVGRAMEVFTILTVYQSTIWTEKLLLPGLESSTHAYATIVRAEF
jgi:hypothetical protein